MEESINVEKLTPGMKLSKPVYIDGTHIILLNKDLSLDAARINMLAQLGVTGVFVYSNSIVAGAQPYIPIETEETIPVNEPAPQEILTDAACAANQHAARFLVVDDEKEICDYIKDVLENSGYIVTIALSAAQAWEQLIKDESIDTVFLDLMMPEVSGVELLKRIRTELKRRVNVVIVTAKKSMQDIITVKELGISGYITKPFDPDRLVVIANQTTSEKKNI